MSLKFRLVLLLALCGGAVSMPAAVAAGARPAPAEGRRLFMQVGCYQCHGTLGLGGFDKIRGSDANEVLEFLTKTANKDIMAAHAQGYTTAQLNKIAAYLQR